MFYTVYKITNLVNNKIYVGVHKTSNLDDDYMGSGKLIKLAIEKYGLENFTKEYLAIFDTAEEMFNMESMLVNEEFIKRDDTYNIVFGGKSGSFEYINMNGMNHLHSNRENSLKNLELGNKAFLEKLIIDSDFKDEWIKKLSDKMRENYIIGMQNGFKNKTHSEETKEKLRGHNRQSGSKNSQFGTIWIHSFTENVNKKIKKDELSTYEQQGWVKGRKI